MILGIEALKLAGVNTSGKVFRVFEVSVVFAFVLFVLFVLFCKTNHEENTIVLCTSSKKGWKLVVS